MLPMPPLDAANQAGACHTSISMQMLPRPTRGIHPACAVSTLLQHILTLVHSLLRFCSGLNQTPDFTSLDWLNKCLFAAASSLAVRWFWQVTPWAWNAFESHSVLFYRDASYHPHRHTVQLHALHGCWHPGELYHSHLYRQSIVLAGLHCRCHNLNRFIATTTSASDIFRWQKTR